MDNMYYLQVLECCHPDNTSLREDIAYGRQLRVPNWPAYSSNLKTFKCDEVDPELFRS